MTLFLLVTGGAIGGFLLLAVVADLLSQSRARDYEIPRNWKSQVFRDAAEDERGLPAVRSGGTFEVSADETTNTPDEQPGGKEMSASVWYTIVIILYIVCLVTLTQWKAIEGWIYPDKSPQQQIHARPAEFQRN